MFIKTLKEGFLKKKIKIITADEGISRIYKLYRNIQVC